MTFLETYEAVPKLAEQGKNKIQQAIDHVDRMRQDAPQEQQQQAEQAIRAAMNRQAEIDTIARRIQANIHLLALTCYDNSIPILEDPDAVL